MRAETLSLKEREFILYAEFSGVGIWKIITSHIIPSVFPTIIVSATTSMANAIMTESSLSFLGVGIQQPMSSWGSLLQNAQGTMQNTFYMALIPGLLIIITIFAFNKLGNLLRVFVEPKIMNDEKE
uniref:ABC transporter permease n=1 Tax=Clostridium sp. NkU-1 TaxID=1095009 RepID=UPI000AB2295A